MLKKMLVPYDGSKPSDDALEEAIKLANWTGTGAAEIILLYVIPEMHLPPSFDYGMRLPNVKTTKEYLKELYQEMKKRAIEMLEEKRKKCAEAGITARTQTFIGHPADKIIAYANDENVDLIVIGNTGLSGLLSKIKTLGSVSRAVSERAKCPVMIVH